MIFETKLVEGFSPAIHAMRNPMNSYDRSDSKWYFDEDDEKWRYGIGANDRDLSERLQKAGPEHCKHLRMINVWVDISAPFYVLKQLDTYRMGVEKVSCSTMHKITARPFKESDFEIDSDEWRKTITDFMNDRYKQWAEATDKDEKAMRWKDIIQCHPESYIQKRTYMFSYAALRNIINQRRGHKLSEWQEFIEWCHTLPHDWMLFT